MRFAIRWRALPACSKSSGRDLPANSAARSVMKDAKEEAMQINRILTELLETARPRPPQFRSSDICGTAEHAVMFARQQAITKRIMIELQVEARASAVEHDPNQINQVLLNLLLNAIQSMEKPGTIRVSLAGDQHERIRGDHRRRRRQGHRSRAHANIFRPVLHYQRTRHRAGLSLAGALLRRMAARSK